MLIQRGEGRSAFHFLVAIETDPECSGAGFRGWPALLAGSDAGQMLAHLAADLKALIAQIRKCRLAAAGALLDQCQILRPGTPVFAALLDAMEAGQSGSGAPELTAVGAVEGRMPLDALQPDRSIPPAVLWLLPMVAEAPPEMMEELAEAMEHRFLAEGQVSPHTASWLEAAFGIGIRHARFMTFTDLTAMFRLQLEHFGHLPLWALIDAAMTGSGEALSLTSGGGTRWGWRDASARVEFQPFDHWANEGPGGALDAEGDTLSRGYVEWTRELRRYVSSLAAHRVPLRFELPEGASGEVQEHYLYHEVAAPPATESLASVTEHSHPDLGIVAVTALLQGAARHYYPLTPRGLNEIHEALQTLELRGEGMAFPGRIELGRSERRLRPAAFE